MDKMPYNQCMWDVLGSALTVQGLKGGHRNNQKLLIVHTVHVSILRICKNEEKIFYREVR